VDKIYAKIGVGLEMWKQHDFKISFEKGIPDYPTNVGFVKALRVAVDTENERIYWNVINGKRTIIEFKGILDKVITPFLKNTAYTSEEVMTIMGLKL
jgi:hypothetical protein